MGFVDDLYAMYREQLTGDENEVIMLVLNILGDHSRDDLKQLIQGMDEDEIRQMIGLFLVEKLKARMVKEGLMQIEDGERTRYH